MYACDECNQRKGNRSPPETARNSGVRFFRPDQDFHHEHFEKSGIRLKPKSITGKFTIDAIDLNRLTLRRIREIRSRLTECDRFVAGGISALRTIHIDHLPAHIKAQAANSIRNASRMGKMLADNIDLLLSDYARSPLIDSDPEATARTIERASELKKLEALYPGSWRASSKQIQRPKRSKRTKKT